MRANTALAHAPTSGTVTAFIAHQIDGDLQFHTRSQAQYQRLSQLWNIWSAKRAQFMLAAASAAEMPRIFYYGPHMGWMDASDFLIVLADIDARKAKLERVSA